MVDYRTELNPAQWDVVSTLDGPILVIAGAGSGKTRVIEYRVLHLIRQHKEPGSILLLTFTRRAAREMLSRACRRDVRAKNVNGGTFHSFAYSILKKHAPRIGFDSFVILDEDDAQDAIAACVKRLGFADSHKRFPKKDTLRKIISAAVNKEMTIDEVLEADYPQFLEWSAQVSAIATEYARFKIEKGYFDYEDLLVNLKILLTKHEPLRREIAAQYHYIMVDEYQDTNTLQADITYLLAKDHANVMVVGDDAQSIYGFRGASHRNIMTFADRFPRCKILKLEANYRSHQQILDVANAVLADMKHKFSKQLVSAGSRSGDKPKLVHFRTGFDEAAWIADKIVEFDDRGTPLNHQAVLFRSSYVSIPLQVELQKRGIPFVVWGGMKFYETAHVKDLVSHLKVVVNPRDEIALRRILMLIDSIGTKTAGRLIDSVSADKDRRAPMAVLAQAPVPAKSARQMQSLCALLEKIADPAMGLVKKFDCLMRYYTPILKDKFDDHAERASDLEALREILAGYRQLDDFLADFTLEPPERSGVPGRAFSGEERVLTLSTIHSAKGLEWDCVYILGLIEGVMPVSFSLNKDSSIEEEHRLLYVALTRAKKHLFLSAHYENSGFGPQQFNRISRFVDSGPVLARLEQIVSEAEDADSERPYDG
ncbi:MAG: ATP-dependent helicase [Candidatus Omnitrophica bacterium]|nr:ATP-dependent helicase [Candidatus Omnitrophota bacterium]